MEEWTRENRDLDVRDSLLRWHFRMCVLSNTRGQGEPIWDYEGFQDDMDRIMSEDPSGTLLSLEVTDRLAQQGYVSVS